MPPFIADQIRVDHNPGTPKENEPAQQPVTIAGDDFSLVEEAIRMVGTAFPWHTTVEGEAFWFDIIKRLHRIKDRGA